MLFALSCFPVPNYQFDQFHVLVMDSTRDGKHDLPKKEAGTAPFDADACKDPQKTDISWEVVAEPGEHAVRPRGYCCCADTEDHAVCTTLNPKP